MALLAIRFGACLSEVLRSCKRKVNKSTPYLVKYSLLYLHHMSPTNLETMNRIFSVKMSLFIYIYIAKAKFVDSGLAVDML